MAIVATPSMNGIAPIGAYGTPTPTTALDALTKLFLLIPNPDSTELGGAQAGGGNLDEMSPIAAAQLRVEILALAGVIGTFNAP